MDTKICIPGLVEKFFNKKQPNTTKAHTQLAAGADDDVPLEHAVVWHQH